MTNELSTELKTPHWMCTCTYCRRALAAHTDRFAARVWAAMPPEPPVAPGIPGAKLEG